MTAVRTRPSVGRLMVVLAIAALAAAVMALGARLNGFATDTAADITFQAVTISGSEPLTIGADDTIARFIDPDNVTPQISRPNASVPSSVPPCGDLSVYTAEINWGDGTAADSATVDCSDVSTSQYAVFVNKDHTFADSGTHAVTVTVADSANDTPAVAPLASPAPDADSTTTAVMVTDASISSGDERNVTGTEGQSVSVQAFFLDSGSRSSARDAGLTGSIDWGDGTTSAGTVGPGSDCECNASVSGSHVYDAKAGGGTYAVKVTLSDDGGSSGSATLTATIGDAKLTAGAPKNFTATGGQAGTFTVASFTDAAAAQAAAGDFTASVKWGDGATSAGTVSMTGAGAFKVSGAHTYATAGTKSLTITVTDEEGQTLTISATATVPPLPATGQADAGPTPGWLLLFMALILGGVSLGTLGMVRARR